MTDFYVIGDTNDSSFCRIAATLTDANDMVSWLTNSPDHTGVYSYATESITDQSLLILFNHAASIDLANFHLDIAQFSGYIPTP